LQAKSNLNQPPTTRPYNAAGVMLGFAVMMTLDVVLG
jgi:hypothetical protein